MAPRAFQVVAHLVLAAVLFVGLPDVTTALKPDGHPGKHHKNDHPGRHHKGAKAIVSSLLKDEGAKEHLQEEIAVKPGGHPGKHHKGAKKHHHQKPANSDESIAPARGFLLEKNENAASELEDVTKNENDVSELEDLFRKYRKPHDPRKEGRKQLRFGKADAHARRHGGRSAMASIGGDNTIGTPAILVPTLLNNNLGGLGPDAKSTSAKFMSLVFGNIAKIEQTGTPVSLSLMNTSTYTAGSADLNGLKHGTLPSINVLSGTNVSLRGVFVNSETGKRIKLSSYTISALNLDRDVDGSGTQQIIAKGFTSYKINGDKSSLKVETMSDGSTSFMATQRNANHEAPEDPMLMDQSSLAGTVALTFEDADEFEFTLQVKNSGKEKPLSASRNFYFAGFPQVFEQQGPDLVAVGVATEEATSPRSHGGLSWIRFFFKLSLVGSLLGCCMAYILVKFIGVESVSGYHPKLDALFMQLGKA